MYVKEQFDFTNPLAGSAFVPPYYLLVALPAYVTSDPAASVFSIMDALWEVFHGSKRTSTLFQPRIWAPGWGEMQLFSYLTDPLPKGVWPFVPIEPNALRTQSFLEPEEAPSCWLKPSCYDIVHFTGAIASPQFGRLWLDDGNKAWTPEELAKKLNECLTRLFILQCAKPESFEAARAFARGVVQSGGVAALAIAGSTEQLRWYCGKLYGGIAHNRPLSEAAFEPAMLDAPGFSVYLALRSDGDESLRLDSWVKSLSGNLEYWEKDLANSEKDWYVLRGQLIQSVRPYVHPAQLNRLIPIEEAERTWIKQLIQALAEQRSTLQALPPQPWHHEREGSLVVSGATQAFRTLRSQLQEFTLKSSKLVQMSLRGAMSLGGGSPGEEMPTEWLRQLRSEVSAAPRVLNAGFRAAGQTEMVNQTQTLLAGKEYELLVDIGPRWDKLQSLVTGSAEFPVQALPPSESGHLVDVVFLSEEFSPPLVSGRIFLPLDSGRSLPWDEGANLPTTGPLILKLRAPEYASNREVSVWVAHGRLGLYFDNNLLQSARVEMSVSRDNMAVSRQPNAIKVDYVLSGGFQDIGGRFAKRKVRFAEDDTWEETKGEGHPLAMSITLNDDGGGSHRILVKSQKTTHWDLPELAAWMTYDPQGAAELLGMARKDLFDCFFEKDHETGKVNNKSSLDSNNGQRKDQFEWDLIRLAERGEKLFSAVFSNLRLSGNIPTGAAQARLFQEALNQPRIIQVARTGPANYTFPWALLYEIPLSHDRRKNSPCKVLGEWDTNGWRANQRATCPYSDEPEHKENTYCPYGFWGLKHVVEQPLSPMQPNEENGFKDARLSGVPPTFGTPGVIPLGLCSTSALQDMSSLDSHLQALATEKQFQAHFPPARGMDAAEVELLNAALVYFLCHGKYDTAEKQPYLGIGPDDNDPQHRIYPTTIESWARRKSWEGPWDRQRPLVFINGCHTCDLTPGQTLQFVSAFGFAGASGVLGTEISVQLALAIEVAKSLFDKIARGIPVGEAFHQIRWDLANKGNLLGLAYTPYCLANLTHAGDGGPEAV